MASNINPNNIDTTYPVAGQDNDSQGFRDNFTNIKSNFEFAETEIDDLQAKGIFKSALTGTTLDNDMAGSIIKNAKLQATRDARVALGAVTGSAAIDYSAGNWYTVTTSGSITLAFSNIPSAGNQAYITVTVTVANTAHTMTLPSAVGNGASAKSVVGIQGIASNIITFAESLTKTASFFTTGGAETATLAAGVEGQIKVLAMAGDGGDMVITVTNAGWKSSGTGTITFNDIGDAVTCMYINSKWFVIGNNGATFA